MIRRLAACLAIALVALVGAAPAHADEELGFSRDGVTWTANLPGPLFPASTLWVPGDVQQSSFYVRNQGPTDGQMTVNALTKDSQKLISSGAMVIAARVGSGPWTALSVGKTRVLPAILKVAQNAISKITVQVAFQPSTTAQMNLAASFQLRITMFQGDVKGINTGHGGHGNGNGSGHVGGINIGNGSGLPNTGSPIELRWIWLAAALIGSGLALVVPRRRREADDG